MPGAAARALLGLTLAALGPSLPPLARAQQQPASLVRPLASLVVPGAGQLLGRQDRGAIYLAAEVLVLSNFLRLNHEARLDAERFRALAYDVARRQFVVTRRDTVFEYYEQMERFPESGRYNADTGAGFLPESDPRTYNGSVWLLARRTIWPDPDVPPSPELYWRAVEFYKAHAVGPDFQWSWRDHALEHGVFRQTIRKSDDSFRRAQSQLGLLLANHVVSAVDALISSRLAAATGRPTTLHTTLGPDRIARLRLSIAF